MKKGFSFLLLLLLTGALWQPLQAQCDESIDDMDMETYSQKALKKTQYLSQYIEIISDRSAGRRDRAESIDLACKLFYDDKRIVQVSSVNTDDIREYTIRKYLEHLRALPYNRVEILWAEIGYVSKLVPSADGNYYGIITIKQKFVGYSDGDLPVYEDITVKHIEVVLQRVDLDYEGRTLHCWDVFLGDINVKETRKG